MGRDKFFDLMRNEQMLVRKTKLYHITTDSNHGFYKSRDLLKDLKITQSEQVFVSDITYIKLASQHAYLALVTDVYSKRIMGYKINTLEMKTPAYAHLNQKHEYKSYRKQKNGILAT